MIIPPIREMTIQELEKLGWFISDEGYERLLDEAENDDPRIGKDFFKLGWTFFQTFYFEFISNRNVIFLRFKYIFITVCSI